MSANGDVQQRLQQILMEVVQGDIAPEQLGPSLALVQGGVSLDSVALLELVVRIEGEFNILLSDGTLTAKDFESLGALTSAVSSEIQKQKGSSKA